MTKTTDSSALLYSRYYSFDNDLLEITLKNNRLIIGKIVGFYRSSKKYSDERITHWHILHCKKQNDEQLQHEEIVEHSIISMIKFYEDNSVIIFS